MVNDSSRAIDSAPKFSAPIEQASLVIPLDRSALPNVVIEQKTLASLPDTQIVNNSVEQPLQKLLHTPIVEHGAATMLGSYAIGSAIAMRANRTEFIENGNLWSKVDVLHGLKDGFRGFVGATSDFALDEVLANKFKSHSALFQPSIPEALSVGAAASIPDIRLRVAAVTGAWLLGRAYNYTWDKLSSK
jgi:hypothetical protein